MTTATNQINLDTTIATLLENYLYQHTTQPISIDPEQLAYRWVGGSTGRLEPIEVNSLLTLSDLLGIDTQKHKVVQNTKQFLAGYPANHVLMTGTRGAGKSSLIRALLNEFNSQGLRIIEVSRDDLYILDKIRQALTVQTEHYQNTQQSSFSHTPRQNPITTKLAVKCRYIVYCDDLAFDAQDENYRTLKSILDGAIDSEQDQILVYATSNRRHLLPQLMKDNVNIYDGQTNEVNPYEAIDETVSLSDRFGLWVSFYPMDQATYLQITQHYLEQNSLIWNDDVKAQALRWASERGGRSGRVAFQFSRHCIGQHLLNEKPH